MDEIVSALKNERERLSRAIEVLEGGSSRSRGADAHHVHCGSGTVSFEAIRQLPGFESLSRFSIPNVLGSYRVILKRVSASRVSTIPSKPS
jgi:hypothetical protein